MDSATLFKLIIELISAIAKLLWPIIALVIILIFQKDIAALLTRIRKGKLFGQEVELDPSVDKFRKIVEEAQSEIPESTVIEEKYEKESEGLDRDVKEILEAAKVNPELGIIRLSSILEREIRVLAGSLGYLKYRVQIPITQLFRIMVEKGFLPKHTSDSLKIFWDIRNQIVHGKKTEDDRIIIKFLDIGLDLLRTVRSIPHEINVVHQSGVDLYSDKDCKNKLEGVKGLILETTSSDKSVIFKRIFPTTNSSYYQKGKRVTWEWNLSNIWEKTWYIDPDDGQTKEAWHSSGEFAGRYMEDI